MDSAVVVKFPPVNRSQKRRVKKAYIKVATVFATIENTFLTDIFLAHPNNTYEDIYRMYLQFWQEYEDSLRSEGWLKLVRVNQDYFVSRYYPIEKL